MKKYVGNMKECEEDLEERVVSPSWQDMKHDLHFLALPLTTFPYSNGKRPNSYPCSFFHNLPFPGIDRDLVYNEK